MLKDQDVAFEVSVDEPLFGRVVAPLKGQRLVREEGRPPEKIEEKKEESSDSR